MNTLPATFLVDAAGKITFARVGAITAADGELDKALKEAMR